MLKVCHPMWEMRYTRCEMRDARCEMRDARCEMRDERCEMQGVGVTRTRKWGAGKPVVLSTHDLGGLPCAIFPLNVERPRERRALTDGSSP
jgi:hypothetical protein